MAVFFFPCREKKTKFPQNELVSRPQTFPRKKKNTVPLTEHHTKNKYKKRVLKGGTISYVKRKNVSDELLAKF